MTHKSFNIERLHQASEGVDVPVYFRLSPLHPSLKDDRGSEHLNLSWNLERSAASHFMISQTQKTRMTTPFPLIRPIQMAVISSMVDVMGS